MATIKKTAVQLGVGSAKKQVNEVQLLQISHKYITSIGCKCFTRKRSGFVQKKSRVIAQANISCANSSLPRADNPVQLPTQLLQVHDSEQISGDLGN